jgi:hypothetical protein
LGYGDIATGAEASNWDWDGVEQLLDNIASHGHQAVLRFFYVYPGYPTTVPGFIKAMDDYVETSGVTEGQPTDFPDWGNATLQAFTLEFFSEFAKRYDDDPRLAFLEVGFGLWAEYHIYEPGEILGENFPSVAFQTAFLEHMDSTFETLRFAISIDAATEDIGPFDDTPALRELAFGLFDDSFLHEEHGDYNKWCFDQFGDAKRLAAPVGGELSYYTDYDQEHALDLPDGPHGILFEELAAQYNVTFMIGSDQPTYQSWERIQEAGMALGYRFEVIGFKASNDASVVTVVNNGIAPIYYDAFVAVNGVRAGESLKGLGPGETGVYQIGAGKEAPVLTIECDRLVDGQQISFDADLTL